MTSLYEITEQYRSMIDALSGMDADDPAIADTIEGMDGVFDDKAVSVIAYARNLEATAEAIKQAESDMAERRKKLEAKAERLRDYVRISMAMIGKSEINSPWFDIRIKKNPAKVVIDDESSLDAKFWRVPEPKPVVDKKLIAAAINDGEKVTGAHIEHGTRLEVK
jgi:hypothetical protein